MSEFDSQLLVLIRGPVTKEIDISNIIIRFDIFLVYQGTS